MHEIEIKFHFPSADEARKRLGGAGAVAQFPRDFEDNRVYDNAERSFSKEWRLLRLRSALGKHTLTYKHPPETSAAGARFKVRIEHDTDLSSLEGAKQILRALGYEEVWRYQKYRQRYRLEDVTLELDELPFGVYLEIEGEPEAIDRVAKILGLGDAEYIKATYRELYCDCVGSSDPGDLLFPESGA